MAIWQLSINYLIVCVIGPKNSPDLKFDRVCLDRAVTQTSICMNEDRPRL